MENFRKIFVYFLIALVAFNFYGTKYANSVEFLPTTVEVLVACGNGITEEANGEVCDPGDPPDTPFTTGTTTCTDFNDTAGNPFTDGILQCLEDCSDFDQNDCYTCGNGIKEPVEGCDGSDYDGKTCLTFGFDGGILQCTIGCQISTTNCEARENEGGLSGGGGSSGGSSGQSSGYNPGESISSETKVIMRGKSYPHADVHILVDGAVVGIVQADARADFYFETVEISAGVASFGFWSEDKDSLKSTLLTLTFRVISGAVTNITGVYISPSIDIDNKAVKQGEEVRIFGQTVPETTVDVFIHSEGEHTVAADSTEDGDWELFFDTAPLEEDFHTAKAQFSVNSNGNIIKSGFSKAVSFHVGKVGGEAPCPEADLNHDGRVNLTDFSILLFNWGTDDPCADQNQNGNVDLIDFSIMMYYWSG
jgi:hypothetical protein